MAFSMLNNFALLVLWDFEILVCKELNHLAAQLTSQKHKDNVIIITTIYRLVLRYKFLEPKNNSQSF